MEICRYSIDTMPEKFPLHLSWRTAN